MLSEQGPDGILARSVVRITRARPERILPWSDFFSLQKPKKIFGGRVTDLCISLRFGDVCWSDATPPGIQDKLLHEDVSEIQGNYATRIPHVWMELRWESENGSEGIFYRNLFAKERIPSPVTDGKTTWYCGGER